MNCVQQNNKSRKIKSAECASKRLSPRLIALVMPVYEKYIEKFKADNELVQVFIEHITDSGATLQESVLLGGCSKNLAYLPISPYRGVSFHKSTQRWRCRVKCNKKSYHHGYFSSELESAACYDRQAKIVFGDKAVCNSYEIAQVLEGDVIMSTVKKIGIPGKGFVTLDEIGLGVSDGMEASELQHYTKDHESLSKKRSSMDIADDFVDWQPTKRQSVEELQYWEDICIALSDDDDDLSIQFPSPIHVDMPTITFPDTF